MIDADKTVMIIIPDDIPLENVAGFARDNGLRFEVRNRVVDLTQTIKNDGDDDAS